ncbi:SNF5-domain-containing protein [Nadsonia fulvescens var. elongata DSM 6958]|uniref:SNF5-domain-containing protein n=1 Tax=Nadsonia fulvescens var. elongata DSM 6958 TaxID=857566 RepID=A0A1E3PPX8_9ASCO|nr:SNF5-domain-containing protein [Nadsonia fulvescens var. elongata DSM 6958]
MDPSRLYTAQAMSTSFASRLRNDNTTLFISTTPVTRTAKRAAAAHTISYAEVDEDFDEDVDGDTELNGLRFNSGTNGSVNRYNGVRRNGSYERKMATKTRHVVLDETQSQAIADYQEVLIPIRINLEYETYRVTDFLMWNLSEDTVTPEHFAEVTCTDIGLPNSYIAQIANAIKTQVAEYTEIAGYTLPAESDLHAIINLSVNLDKHLYEDKFEWDLTGTDMTPEMFAKTVTADLGLVGEFYPAIAHALHESILKMKKEALEGHLPQEVDNQAAFGAEAGWRVDQENLGEEWAPTVEVLSQEEIEKREIERERNIRRLKRESARLGETITDIGGFSGNSYRKVFSEMENSS